MWLVHEPGSCVYHSHEYSLREWLMRNVDDGVANALRPPRPANSLRYGAVHCPKRLRLRCTPVAKNSRKNRSTSTPTNPPSRLTCSFVTSASQCPRACNHWTTIALTPNPDGSSPALCFRFTLTTRRLPDMMAFPAHHGSYATTIVAKRDVAQFAVAGPVSEPVLPLAAGRWQVSQRSRTQNVSHLDSQPPWARTSPTEGVNFDRFDGSATSGPRPRRRPRPGQRKRRVSVVTNLGSS